MAGLTTAVKDSKKILNSYDRLQATLQKGEENVPDTWSFKTQPSFLVKVKWEQHHKFSLNLLFHNWQILKHLKNRHRQKSWVRGLLSEPLTFS